LITWFLLLSLLSVTAASVLSAIALSRVLNDRFLALDLKLTTEFVNNMYGAEAIDEYLADPSPERRHALEGFFTHVGRMPDVLRANIYQLDGTLLWSTDTTLVGRRFPGNESLAAAGRGEPHTELGRLLEGEADKAEHERLPANGQPFIESYIPVFRSGQAGHEVLGVVEVYRTPQAVFEAIRAGRLLVLICSGAGACVILGTLCWLVYRAHAMIRRQEAAITEAERLATAGKMAGAVAHGLRNPLAAIRSSAELALRLSPPERVHALLDDIVLQSDRLVVRCRQKIPLCRVLPKLVALLLSSLHF
jgi:signal transduction histidine kinase